MAKKKSIKKDDSSAEDVQNVEVNSAEEVKAETENKEEAKAEKKEEVKEESKKEEKAKEEVQVAPKAAGKLYEIKFLKNHEFNIGVVAYDKKKNDKMKVERHLANTLSGRGIAVIVD